ncbi:Dihydrosphingosine phosphate lyase [Rhodotorula kratochvilovae]
MARVLSSQVLTLQSAKTALFWYLVLRQFIRVVRHLRARGLLTAAREAYLVAVRKGFACMLLLPSVRAKVQGELDQVTLDLERKLAPKLPNAPSYLALPEAGLSAADVSAALAQLSDLPRTEWEGGRVSGAVYHGGKDMGDIWREAFGRFEVSNPLHADVFPGVRKMDSEVVSMCLSLYNAPLPASAIDDGGAGTTTSGGTESILMACKAYRDRARAEFGITEPEMIVSKSAHAAFDKAAMYFGIKIHHIPVDRETRQVQIAKVRRAINANTILLVGSAPNFPDGAIDDIAALSDLAVKHPRMGLHVDCCLGSFLVPFLERAGFPTVPFDFRVPGVTSISCDTHKYGFSPKGSSCIMYRSKAFRKYQYSVTTTWPGGVYATPSMSGSRPGAIIAGAWASLVHMGIDGYTASCREIVGAAKRIAHGVRKDFPELYVLGDPLVSVVAFGSTSEGQGNGKGAVPIYEVGDRMSRMGWHLNALQDPPALHIACTRLTVPAVDDFLRDLRLAVDEVKALEEPGKGSMVMLYMDVLYA